MSDFNIKEAGVKNDIIFQYNGRCQKHPGGGGGQPLDKKWEGKVGILLFWSFTWVNMTVYSLYPPAYMGYRSYIRLIFLIY